MAESEEALQLKRRARRRLVGAIALVTFAVIILPLVLDKEPGPAGPLLDVQIPSQESGGFNTRILPPVPALPAAPASEEKAVTAPVDVKPPPVAPARPAAKAEPKVAPEAPKEANKADALRAQAALNDQAWMVPLDAFSDMKNVTQLRAKLSAAGVKSYTESVKTSKGELTRVRAGPFASQKAAEKARAKLSAMGLKPGAVASR
ncbi:MAG: SPOR domain-containing protein [Burkholderiales bacterium]|nr:SPOR domain-containing protein [Burkholderiales bacterium]